MIRACLFLPPHLKATGKVHLYPAEQHAAKPTNKNKRTHAIFSINTSFIAPDGSFMPNRKNSRQSNQATFNEPDTPSYKGSTPNVANASIKPSASQTDLARRAADSTP